ncbi:hypothetical protein ACTFIU_009677 [Dictyostelium citrinum]
MDPNYELLKKEFNNLYENSSKLNESISSFCDKIKEIYLNDNSFFNYLSKSYQNTTNNEQQHLFTIYGDNLKHQIGSIINEWLINQSNNITTITNFNQVLNIIKLNIQSVDTLEQKIIQQQRQSNNNHNNNNNNINEYINEKLRVFNDVKSVFQDRAQSLDIPNINFQFSIESLIQTLNTVYTNSSYILEMDLPQYVNPILGLSPINDHVLQSQPIVKPTPFTLKKRPISVYGGLQPLPNNQQQSQLPPTSTSTSQLSPPQQSQVRPRATSVYGNDTSQTDSQPISSLSSNPLFSKFQQQNLSQNTLEPQQQKQQQIIKPRSINNIPTNNSTSEQSNADKKPTSLSSNPLFDKLQQQQPQSQPQQTVLKPRPFSIYGNTPANNSSGLTPLRPAPIPKELQQQQQQQLESLAKIETQQQESSLPTRQLRSLSVSSSPIYSPPPSYSPSQSKPSTINRPLFKQPPSYSPQPHQIQQQQQQQQKQQIHLTYSKLMFNNMQITKILGREIISQCPVNSYYRYKKSDPYTLPKEVPTIDELMNDHETHKRMWNRRFKVNRNYKFSFRYTAKKTWTFEKDNSQNGFDHSDLNQLKKFVIYMHKPQSIQTQHIISSKFYLHCESTNRIIDSIEIPTNLYPCYKIDYLNPPTLSNYNNDGWNFSVYHITEAEMYSNALEEVEDDEEIEYTPISEQEIYIYTRPDELCNHDAPEFQEFIKKYQLEPITFTDGTKESILCFCYRVSLFIKKHMVYNSKFGTQKALKCMETGFGACGSFSAFFSSITRYNNIPTRYISGRSIHEKSFRKQSEGSDITIADCGCHSQIEFYCEGLWVPFNGAKHDNVFNRNAFGKNNGSTYIQQLNLTTNVEYSPNNSRYSSLTNPRIVSHYSTNCKLSPPVDTYLMEITNQ